MMSAKGIALVTGSAQGIGRSIALRLADDGFDVVINDIPSKKDTIDAVVNEIQQKGRRGLGIPVDVSVESDVMKMVLTVVKELGGLDVMVANAGIVEAAAFLDASLEQWEKVMAVNARGIFLCYKYAAKQMVKQSRPGRIIGASSIAGKTGMPALAAYCASKFAVRGLTQSAASELGKYGITVNAYAPGAIDTPMVTYANEEVSKASGVDIAAQMREQGKIGSTEDIAGLVSYLASAESQFITGQTISINGGTHFD